MQEHKVAPLAGAWIEMLTHSICRRAWQSVAPLAGAWIEIAPFHASVSNPQWVAPLAGAWIEIDPSLVKPYRRKGRSPRGSVD